MSDKYIPLSKNGLQLQKTKNTKYDGQMRLKNTWEQSGGMLQPSHESPPSRPQAMTFSQGQLSFHNLTIHSATRKAYQGVDELMKTGQTMRIVSGVSFRNLWLTRQQSHPLTLAVIGLQGTHLQALEMLPWQALVGKAVSGRTEQEEG